MLINSDSSILLNIAGVWRFHMFAVSIDTDKGFGCILIFQIVLMDFWIWLHWYPPYDC